MKITSLDMVLRYTFGEPPVAVLSIDMSPKQCDKSGLISKAVRFHWNDPGQDSDANGGCLEANGILHLPLCLRPTTRIAHHRFMRF